MSSVFFHFFALAQSLASVFISLLFDRMADQDGNIEGVLNYSKITLLNGSAFTPTRLYLCIISMY
ncbi:MAG: hypothetical protein A3B99_00595 [Candidatus Yanofskybacteria bacterium RIFCSPHIGHO2_02_FULL_44_12b]|nr:MAG: hypothetical protein A3B99_00595 [Candidatus Yanofskybacteria bacterium RIFCSPHIGHO2_02_FULL_44_12b]